jgi:hypothetical protein
MRSHDRTLLSSLGFNDPDKKDPRHDLACRYIGQPEIAGKVLTTFNVPLHVSKVSQNDFEFEGEESQTLTLQKASYEWPLSKGDGQYKVTIGFLDVLLRSELAAFSKGRQRSKYYFSPWGEWRDVDETSRSNVVVGVEVKVGEVGAGEIMRQVRLYREHMSFKGFVVATAFALSPGGAEQLHSANIRHFVLGKGFERFCAIEDAKAPAQSPEL